MSSTLKQFLYDIQNKSDKSNKDILRVKDLDQRRNLLNLRIIVLLDCSGSISSDDFRKFRLQLDKIKGMSRIRVIEMDTDVVSMFDYDKAIKPKIVKLGGGGGTDFESAIKTALQCKPQALVFLTDGQDSGNLSKPPIPSAVVLKAKPGNTWYPWAEVCGYIK